MRHAVITALVFGMAVVVSMEARAALSLGWADEIALGWVDATSDTSHFTAVNLYQGRVSGSSLQDAPRTWEFIGQQGANPTGRTNARTKVMFRWEQLVGNTCLTTTVTISRFKVTGVPALGTSCATGVQSLQAVSSQTFQECTSGQTKIQQRLLPTLDFTAETGTGDIAYRATLGVTTDVTSGSQDGCFKIRWF